MSDITVTFTVNELKASKEFGWFVKGTPVLIHNTYLGEPGITPAYVVVSKSQSGYYSIQRFWKSPNRKDQLDKIYHEEDYENLDDSKVMNLLMTEYTNSL